MAKPLIVRRLAHTRLRDLPNWVTNTRLEWARTQTPEPVSSRRAISILFPEVSAAEVEEYRLEFLGNAWFFEALDRAMLARRSRRCRWVSWVEFFYVAIRIMKPELVCETGVFDGESSAVELLALAKNQKGSLISIDLPAFGIISGSTDQMIDATLPPACQPGWIVPESLRERWQLVLGDSRRVLPDILNERGVVDIFFHDSLHTFDHMYFEYTECLAIHPRWRPACQR